MLDKKNIKILIVDDEIDLREAIGEYMELSGFEVITAHNGSQALEILKNTPVDLILSDIRMPDGDGIMLLDAIRKVNKNLPVLVLMTGYSDVSAQECLNRGAQLVIAKPFTNEKLLHAIRSIVT